MDEREKAAAELAENREQVGRMTRNPTVLRSTVAEGAEPLWKDLMIAGMAHEKAREDWTPYCESGPDEHRLYLAARDEIASSPLGTNDPDAHNRRLHAELFLLSAEKLQEALRAFVEETSFDWKDLP